MNDIQGLDNAGFQKNEKDSVEASTKKDEDEEAAAVAERGQWGNGIEFLMSCIAMSVGLGNIWRFPFTAYDNGGGAFLIPYIIVLVLIGRPVYYLEMCLGQFTSRGNVKTFQALAPALKGIGYGQAIGSIGVATYYCSLMAITLFYFAQSFTNDLPWSTCRPEWTTENVTCIDSNSKDAIDTNISYVGSSQMYFKDVVLNELSDISDGIGVPDWRLTLCLFASWVPTFVVSMNGVQSSGKASYFLAIFPYVVMITLLVKAVTLEGAAEGMLYFIRPQWDKLLEAKVWYTAVSQCFFSLNIGFGTVIMYSSYNDFNHNIYRDAIVVSFMDTFTSILAGTTIFGILGSLAYKQKVDVDQVIDEGGAGLAFISYPEAIAKFDQVPWLFAILFFLMLFILGVGSLIALQGSAFTVIMDNFPNTKKWHVSLGCAISGFLIGLVYVTPGGQFMVTFIDFFAGNFIFYLLTSTEVIAIFWWYGLDNFCNDVEFMLKRKVGIYWRISWGVLTPAVLIAIFIYFIATSERLKHGGVDYPDHVLVVGWIIVLVALSQVVIWWAYYVIHKRHLGWSKAFALSTSHSGWGPQNKKIHAEWMIMKEEYRLKKLKENKTKFRAYIDVLLGRN